MSSRPGSSEDATSGIGRLSKPEQYARVYADSKSWYNDLVVLRAMPNGLSESRCGFSVGKRLGKAVVRNRIKRRLREIVRLSSIRPGWDMVLIARQPSAVATYAELNQAVSRSLARAGIMAGPSL